MHLSTLDVSFGSFVYGSRDVWRGHTAAFRIAAYDPRGIDLVGPLAVEAKLRDESGEISSGRAAGASFVELSIHIPAKTEPQCDLELRITTPLGEDVTRVPLDVHDEPPAIKGHIVSHENERPKDAAPASGPYDVAVYPWGGHPVAGIENMVSGILTREGAPIAAELHSDGFGIHSESDEDGLFSFPYTPMPKPTALRFTIGKGPDTIEVPLRAQPAGLLLETKPRGFVRPGRTIAARINALPFRVPIHVDFWVGHALVMAASGHPEQGLLEAELTIPKDARGFVRVEAYRNLNAGDDSRSTALLWVSPEPPSAAARDALEGLGALPGEDVVLTKAAEAQGDARAELARLALSRYVPEQAGLPLLRSTLNERSEAVETIRSRLRGGVHNLFLLTIIVGLGLIVSWIIRHQLRMRRSMREVMEEGVSAGEEIDTEGMRKLARVSHLYDLLFALGALGLTIYGIFMLLTNIRWEWLS